MKILGAWFWSSTGIDSYDTDEDGFSSKEAAEDDMADFALNQEPGFDIISGNKPRILKHKEH